jgi:hypothetical protein
MIFRGDIIFVSLHFTISYEFFWMQSTVNKKVGGFAVNGNRSKQLSLLVDWSQIFFSLHITPHFWIWKIYAHVKQNRALKCWIYSCLGPFIYLPLGKALTYFIVLRYDSCFCCLCPFVLFNDALSRSDGVEVSKWMMWIKDCKECRKKEVLD